MLDKKEERLLEAIKIALILLPWISARGKLDNSVVLILDHIEKKMNQISFNLIGEWENRNESIKKIFFEIKLVAEKFKMPVLVTIY